MGNLIAYRTTVLVLVCALWSGLGLTQEIAPDPAGSELLDAFAEHPLTAPDGERITARVRGGEGPVLVLLPGTWGDLQRFAPLIALLPPEISIVVIELSWQGGLTPSRLDFSMEQLADTVAWALGELEVESYFLGGHSLGGMIAVELAGRNLPGMLGAIPMEGWTHHTVRETAFGDAPPLSPEQQALAEASRNRGTAHLTEEHRDAIRTIWRRWNGYERLEHAAMPILHVWGDRGMPRPDREALQIPDRPSIEIAWMPGASHMLVLETPDALAEALLGFMRQHAPMAGEAKYDQVIAMARELVGSGYSAGQGYQEVWIRDLNTFIKVALAVRPRAEVKENLRRFFLFQGEDGNIPDGFVPKVQAGTGYEYIHSPLAPTFLAHKNTVETDQETSLVQAVAKYVEATGDSAFLAEKIYGHTVLERLQQAMQFLLKHRYAEEYGLLWGGTTADWGDVQPEHEWGVVLDENSHLAIDIYDNAMFMIALQDLADLLPPGEEQQAWETLRQQVGVNVREHLWEEERNKFKPHLYLDGSPFPADFDEDAIHYHGGTAVAILAGLLTREEIAAVLAQQRANVRAAGAASIGLTLYPAYPEGFFKNPILSTPHTYQNGGDWTWFGARMITALALNGFVEEARVELQPMVDRVLANNDFFEWYSLDNQPRGSANYRGSAGVLVEAITAIREHDPEYGGLAGQG